MKNKITDLRNHMFAALERLDNDSLTPEQLKNEVAKAQAMSEIGKVIVDSVKVELIAVKIKQKMDGPISNFLEEKGAALPDTTAEEKEVLKLERPVAVYSNKSAMGISNPGLA